MGSHPGAQQRQDLCNTFTLFDGVFAIPQVQHQSSRGFTCCLMAERPKLAGKTVHQRGEFLGAHLLQFTSGSAGNGIATLGNELGNLWCKIVNHGGSSDVPAQGLGAPCVTKSLLGFTQRRMDRATKRPPC